MGTANIEDIYPLSPMQQGMLYHALHAPETGAYFEQSSWVFRGELNLAAFERAWQSVVQRHSALRTSFMWEDLDEPLQVVHRHVDLTCQSLDWRSLPPDERESRLEAFLQADRQRGFDLTEAPLMRLMLIRTADDSYQFLWSHHHLLLDGWSLPLVFEGVISMYESCCMGRPPHVEGARPFRDYIAWLKKRDNAAAEDFWRRSLLGFTIPTPLLPGAVIPVSERVDDYVILSKRIPRESTAALVAFARRHGLTLSAVIQGAWALLLGRYSGEDDVVFGATVSGRPPDLPGVGSMVGLFINTLPVRVKMQKGISVLSLLKKRMAFQVESSQYEYCSLLDIQGWSSVPRNLPLFESILVFENYPADRALFGRQKDLRVETGRPFTRTNYPLTLSVSPGEEMEIELAYDATRFDPDAIRRMLGHLGGLLDGMVADPEQPLEKLTLLTEREQRQVLREWNDTERELPSNTQIHGHFEAQAERTPDAVAVVLESSELTYGELNRRANQVAHRLQRLGVGPGTLVGLFMDRSLEMVIGLLGILKAGGAYLPLDPAYPPERLRYMVEDSGVRLVLSQEKLRTRCSELRVASRELGVEGSGLGDQNTTRSQQPATRSILCVDTDWPIISRESDENPCVGVSPDSLAYVIYTSGSMGTPKGVMISHRSLANHGLAMKGVYDFSAGDRLLQFISLSFDASAEEIYPSLISGATLVLSPPQAQQTGAEFLRLCEVHGVNMLHLPAPVWHQWVDDLVAGGLRFGAPPKLLLVGGERPSIEAWRSWSGLLNAPSRFLNAYGPTEATVSTTLYEASWEEPFPSAVPIGKPIPNVSTFILDHELRPVPLGVAGELHVGGVSIARGYLGRPDLTAEKFIPNLFSKGQGGERLYRTGDFARHLPEGNILFSGRRDDQVKVRGFRIELGEIEAVLARHEAVSQAVALAQKDDEGQGYLAAYVVVKGDIAPEALKEFLKESLPHYMVPVLVIMDSLPLTPSGKVDRRALPAPEGVRAGSKAYGAPRTPVEEMLCELWAQVLGVGRVGVKDNFYDLGGHSLKATQLVSRIQRVLDVEVKIRDLLETLTPAGLAERVETRRTESSGLKVPPFERVSREGDLPLSFSQQRLWFLDQLAPGSTFYNIPMAVRMKGRLDASALEASLNEIVRRHEALRTCFSQAKGKPVQVILPALKVSLAVDELTGPDREAKAGEIVTREAQRPFDLERGPLLRGRLLRLGEEEHIAVLAIHHIVSDGWSMGLMIRELAALYEARVQNRLSPLPELFIQYADFAAWQRGWLQGEMLDAQLAYWKERLKGVPPMLELPTDRPRQVIQSPQGATHAFSMPNAVSEGLRKLGRDQNVTLFMTLLSAFEVLLFRYTGQEDFCVGTPIANRNRQEVEDLIGFFVNTLVLRADLSGKPDFAQVLERVRRNALEAYTHQDLPFEALVEALQPQRDLSHTPLFQVMFTMDPPLSGRMEFPGLSLSALEVNRGSSLFALTLAMRDTPEGLSGYFEYNRDLFDEATIRRMAEHYARLLEGVADQPEQSIDRLPLLGEAEQQSILEWNAGEMKTPTDRCVHELFEDQARRQPDAVALLFEDRALSYRELNRRANQLARHLMKLGVGPEALVGISTERSSEMIVAILGVLKAGGAYLPLDPSYPPERLRYMVEDSGVRVILTLEGTRDVGRGAWDVGGKERNEGRDITRNPQPATRNTLCLDTDWPMIAQQSDENPVVNVTPRNLAYIIYTSGSTGRPKGTMLSHAGLSNLTAAQRQAFGIDTESRVLQFSPLSFDASVWETFMALANGAALCLARQEVLASGVELARLIEEKRVTNVTLPPSVVRVLPEEFMPLLRTVIAAGEACTAELAERWGRGCEFYNAYGPTETTVCASMKLCSPGDEGPPPIGRPLANGRLYVLDGNLEPLPVGVPGELCVGGVSLARGYFNRPDLTAEKFIPDPFEMAIGRSPTHQSRYGDGARSVVGGQSGQGGERLYRTGDLVRSLPDGEIQFLGRIDQQVKVRGFRIELGEIEEILLRMEGVKEGVVLALGDRLVAFVVPEKMEEPPSTAQLRAGMRQALPEYMVPSLFVVLESLPMTPSGKVDRKALPAPDRAISLRRDYVPPTDLIEETLASMYQDLLGLERIGIHDNFFELGGHSLLATRLASRIREEFHVEIPLRTVFEHPNVAELAQAVTGFEKSQEKSAGPSIVPRSRDAHKVKRSTLAPTS